MRHDAREAGGDLGVERVDLAHPVLPEPVAGAVRRVEADRVALAEGVDEGPHPVRVGDVEGGMRHESRHPLQGVGKGGGRLQREPLVHDEGVFAPPLLERRERFRALLAVDVREAAERGDRIGHVVGRLELGQAFAPRGRGLGGREIAEAGVREGAAGGPLRIEPPGRAGAKPPPDRLEVLPEPLAEGAPQGAARAVDRVHVDPLHAVGEVALRRQGQQLGRERPVDGAVEQDRPHRFEEGGVGRFRAGLRGRAAGSGPTPGPALDHALDQPVETGEGERLPRVPARERVGVVGEEGEEVLVRALHRDPDRGGEPPEHRRDRRALDAGEAKGLDRFPDVEHHRAVRPGRAPRTDRLRPGLLRRPGRRGRYERPPVPPDEAHRQRDVHGFLRRPVRGRGKLLPDPEAPHPLLRVVVVFEAQGRGPGLGVPAPELPEVDPRGVLHRGHEVVGRGGRAVVAFEV